MSLLDDLKARLAKAAAEKAAEDAKNKAANTISSLRETLEEGADNLLRFAERQLEDAQALREGRAQAEADAAETVAAERQSRAAAREERKQKAATELERLKELVASGGEMSPESGDSSPDVLDPTEGTENRPPTETPPVKRTL